MESAFGRERIIAVAVALADTTVLTMNQYFSFLVDGDGARRSFGLGLSIPFVVFTSNLLAALMDRYPIIIWAGAGILGRVGAEMILTDPFLLSLWNAPSAASIAIQAACVAGVLIAGKLLARKSPNKGGA